MAKDRMIPRLLLVAALTSGCGGRGETATSPPGPNDRIEMSRGPCFGTCPVYTVTIRGDGRVRYEGREWVKSTGHHEGSARAADVAALFAYADSIGFFDLPADITPANEAACGGAWTDMPSAEVAIARPGRAHVVNHYHGCPKAPERLTRLENRIDEVAGTSRWIGASE